MGKQFMSIRIICVENVDKIQIKFDIFTYIKTHKDTKFLYLNIPIVCLNCMGLLCIDVESNLHILRNVLLHEKIRCYYDKQKLFQNILFLPRCGALILNVLAQLESSVLISWHSGTPYTGHIRPYRIKFIVSKIQQVRRCQPAGWLDLTSVSSILLYSSLLSTTEPRD